MLFSFTPSDTLNFGTKFLEGWVYVTTLVEQMIKDYKVKLIKENDCD